jgi:hypothetical protein
LCVVDDAQWLDVASAQVLALVSRQLFADTVAVSFEVREPSAEERLAGLPELVVEGRDDGNARARLGSAVTGRLDRRVVDRIVAETRGNPLALLELTRGLSAAQLAARFDLSGTLPLLERARCRCIATSPARTSSSPRPWPSTTRLSARG